MTKTVIGVPRHEFVRTLFPKRGVIAEVGVEKGAFAEAILKECNPFALFLIDCWKHQSGGYAIDTQGNHSDEVHERHRLMVLDKARLHRNVVVMPMMSHTASDLFADNVLDAVYLDADHTEDGIRADIGWWWPKVRRGGVLSGHDYCERPWIQVQRVVDVFAEANGLDLLISGEPDYPSWAVRKP